MKKCPNCGKMNLDKANVCKECQWEIHDVESGTFEVKNNNPQPVEQKDRKQDGTPMVILTALLCIFAFFVVFYVDGLGMKILLAVLFAVPIIICISKLNSIDRANGFIPKAENIEYCPHCHSREIKIYRKGYDYGKGLRWTLLGGGKYGRYMAGMDSNKACCRCMDCGKDWETDYDYRLIKK